jgi:thiamine kinase-like enzyme
MRMQPPEAQSIAREAVPGNGEPLLSQLGSGLLNETYRVERDGRVFSMRVSLERSEDRSRRDRVKDRIWELSILEEAVRRELAPPLVYGDAERGILVQDWIAGRAWPAGAARLAENINRMAGLLLLVHQLPQPATTSVTASERIVRPSQWIEHYGAALAAANIGVSAPLVNAAALRLASLDALPRPAEVVCHSDLHLLNLIEECLPGKVGSSLKLLDWEYAHVSEPFWDLAGWGSNNDFSDRLLRALLRAYLDREPLDAEWTRCKLLVWLYDYVCLLWSELYVNSSRGSGLLSGSSRSIAMRAGVLRGRLAAQY